MFLRLYVTSSYYHVKIIIDTIHLFTYISPLTTIHYIYILWHTLCCYKRGLIVTTTATMIVII